MLYVQQSLASDEELIFSARFHWMYTFRAVLWIVFGLAIGMAIGYGAIWWVVSSSVREVYSELPDENFSAAWAEMVTEKGGYLQILWSLSPFIRFAILGFFILGLAFFTHMMIVKATTEIAVTNRRVIYKKGLVARHVGELAVDRIEGVSVSQEFWGRIWGYGRVSIRGMGVGEVILPPIEAPIAFHRAIQEARSMQEKSGVVKTTHDDF